MRFDKKSWFTAVMPAFLVGLLMTNTTFISNYLLSIEVVKISPTFVFALFSLSALWAVLKNFNNPFGAKDCCQEPLGVRALKRALPRKSLIFMY